MRLIATLALLATTVWTASPAFAAPRQAQCKLIVDGKAYINGPCRFDTLDADGSFTITGKTYFAYVTIADGEAHATWNKDPKSTHAHADLGDVKREGACWTNARTRICASGIRR